MEGVVPSPSDAKHTNVIQSDILVSRRGGEIGRHAAFRSQCSQGLAGSSPALGTTFRVVSYRSATVYECGFRAAGQGAGCA